MNGDQRWIADAFLAELSTVKLNEQPPMHVIDKRLLLAGMVLTEVPGDDPEEVALRAQAETLRDLYRDPTDPVGVVNRYIAAQRAYLDLLKSMLKARGLQLPDEAGDTPDSH